MPDDRIQDIVEDISSLRAVLFKTKDEHEEFAKKTTRMLQALLNHIKELKDKDTEILGELSETRESMKMFTTKRELISSIENLRNEIMSMDRMMLPEAELNKIQDLEKKLAEIQEKLEQEIKIVDSKIEEIRNTAVMSHERNLFDVTFQEIERLKEDYTLLRGEMDEEKNVISALSTRLSDVETLYRSLSDNIRSVRTDVDKISREFSGIRDTITGVTLPENLIQDMQTLHDRVKVITSDVETLKLEHREIIQGFGKELKDVKNELKVMRETRDALSRVVNDTRERLDTLTETVDMMRERTASLPTVRELDEKIKAAFAPTKDKLLTELDSFSRRLAQIENKYESLQERIRNSISKLENSYIDIQNKIRSMELKLEDMTLRFPNMEDRIKEIRETISQLMEKQNEVESAAVRINSQLSGATMEIDNLKKKVTSQPDIDSITLNLNKIARKMRVMIDELNSRIVRNESEINSISDALLDLKVALKSKVDSRDLKAYEKKLNMLAARYKELQTLKEESQRLREELNALSQQISMFFSYGAYGGGTG